MSILEIKDALFQIEKAWCDDDTLYIKLKSELVLSTPLKWYPRLHTATHEQRNQLRILPFGDGIHWPELDEDLSVKGVLRFAATQGEPAHDFEAAE